MACDSHGLDILADVIRRLFIARIFLCALPIIGGGYRSSAAASFSTVVQTGNLANTTITEASGIVASRMNANVLWTHNDSGHPAQIFAMTPEGTDLGTYNITGAASLDWEDIAIGPGPIANTQYLYIGDIGDNFALRSTVAVYRVPEPVVSDTQAPVTASIADAVKFTFTYPDGAHDAESLFVDPLTKDIYIISKPGGTKNLYRAAYAQYTSGNMMLDLVTTFSDGDALTAADISPDGNEIIIRSYATTSGRMYVRPLGGSIADAFNAPYTSIPIPSESIGEAIGFDPNGRGFYTTGEGVGHGIWYFDRLPPPARSMYWDNDGAETSTYVATGGDMGGSGTWDSSSQKWYNGSAVVPWADGNDAVFWGTAGTVTLAAARSANNLAFKTSGYNVTGSTLTLSGGTVSVDAGVTATISSVVGGSTLTKAGAGTLLLSNANTYSGGTFVAAGTLLVTNTTGSGTGSGAVAVDSGATLGGTGTIAGNVVNSGIVAPGMSAGTIHIGGTYAQAPGGTLAIELASNSNYDVLDVTGAANLSGTLIVSLISGFAPQQGSVFQIINASTLNATTFSTTSLPALSGSLAWKVSYGANFVTLSVTLPGDFNQNGTVDAADYVVWRDGLGLTYVPSDYNLWRSHLGQTASSGSGAMAAAVPEPESWIFLGAATAMLLFSSPGAAARRRSANRL